MSEVLGFIGLGTMGRPMAENLIKGGYSLVVYDPSSAATKSLAKLGAVVVGAPAEVTQQSRTIILMLPDSPQVEEVVLGDSGLLKTITDGTLVADMSTISPSVAQRIAEMLRKKGCGFVDAPVSGGPAGAAQASLTIMVGGRQEDFDQLAPVFQKLGKTITHVGEVGSGQAVKLCNQIMVTVNLMAVCEALSLAKGQGIDPETMCSVLKGGAANSWMLENMAHRMINDDPSAGFRIDLQLKDLRLALEAAFEKSVPLPATSLVTQLYLEARAHGGGGDGNQALYRVYDRLIGSK